MLCQECKEREANTYVKKIINGKKQEYHVCSQCAEKLGLLNMNQNLFSGFSSVLGDFFSEALPSFSGTLANPVRCSDCGSTYRDIAKNGVVGCSRCYQTFYHELLPSIKRIHGNTVHCGKNPSVSGKEVTKTDDKKSLQLQLEQAVKNQEFEKAAELRDRIKSLKESE